MVAHRRPPRTDCALVAARGRLETAIISSLTEFDAIAERYDETRGGEARGDQYAADVDARLPAGEGPVLEIGVGTGVVALGLARRGRTVIGVDLSPPMLGKARDRLGPKVVCCDAASLAVASSAVAHAVSVWVVHAVGDPAALFREAARVLRPGGCYVVCTTQRADPHDAVGRIIAQASLRAAAHTGVTPSQHPPTTQIVAWAEAAGFTATVRPLGRRWQSSPDEELAHLELRTWPGLRDLDDHTFRAVAAPAADALAALPPEAFLRLTTADLLVLRRP